MRGAMRRNSIITWKQTALLEQATLKGAVALVAASMRPRSRDRGNSKFILAGLAWIDRFNEAAVARPRKCFLIE